MERQTDRVLTTFKHRCPAAPRSHLIANHFRRNFATLEYLKKESQPILNQGYYTEATSKLHTPFYVPSFSFAGLNYEWTFQ